MSRISTHILDLVQGHPASNVPVRLERKEASGDWRLLASALTDNDGRCTELLPEAHALTAGLYRLTFDTESYFAAKKLAALYPVVEVTFRVQEQETHFHIPLLLSPNGYSTYRGS